MAQFANNSENLGKNKEPEFDVCFFRKPVNKTNQSIVSTQLVKEQGCLQFKFKQSH